MKYIDIPKYIVRPVPGRFLITRLLVLLILGIILYIGIIVNYYLLNLDIPALIHWIIILLIIIISVCELMLCYVRYGRYSYSFYEDKVIIKDPNSENILYSGIKSLSYDNNIFDRFFKTGSIIITLNTGKLVKLKHLRGPTQAYFLMQKGIKR